MIRKDLDLNFIKNPITGDINVKKNDDAIKQSLKTLLLLGSYEKPFNNNLGPDLNGFIFQNYIIGTEKKIEERIRTTLKQYEPGLNIKNLSVYPNDKNQIMIDLEYYFTGNIPKNISLTMERTR
jgi:phage baseplate assembly protein W